jgi:hypothetical protein
MKIDRKFRKALSEIVSPPSYYIFGLISRQAFFTQTLAKRLQTINRETKKLR